MTSIRKTTTATATATLLAGLALTTLGATTATAADIEKQTEWYCDNQDTSSNGIGMSINWDNNSTPYPLDKVEYTVPKFNPTLGTYVKTEHRTNLNFNQTLDLELGGEGSAPYPDSGTDTLNFTAELTTQAENGTNLPDPPPIDPFYATSGTATATNTNVPFMPPRSNAFNLNGTSTGPIGTSTDAAAWVGTGNLTTDAYLYMNYSWEPTVVKDEWYTYANTGNNRLEISTNFCVRYTYMAAGPTPTPTPTPTTEPTPTANPTPTTEPTPTPTPTPTSTKTLPKTGPEHTNLALLLGIIGIITGTTLLTISRKK